MGSVLSSHTRIVPDRMVLQEISYQTVIDGVFPNIALFKRKCWPKFHLNLGLLIVKNYTRVAVSGKTISKMSLV